MGGGSRGPGDNGFHEKVINRMVFWREVFVYSCPLQETPVSSCLQ